MEREHSRADGWPAWLAEGWVCKGACLNLFEIAAALWSSRVYMVGMMVHGPDVGIGLVTLCPCCEHAGRGTRCITPLLHAWRSIYRVCLIFASTPLLL